MELLLQTQEDVFWLDICVDDFTLSVKVVQALKHLQKDIHKFDDDPFHPSPTVVIRKSCWLGPL